MSLGVVQFTNSQPKILNTESSNRACRRVVALQAYNPNEVATARLPGRVRGVSGAVLVPLTTLAQIVEGCGLGRSLRLIGTAEETRILYPVDGTLVDRLNG